MKKEITSINNINVSSNHNYIKANFGCLLKCCKRSKRKDIIKKENSTKIGVNEILTYKKDLLKLDKVSTYTKISSTNDNHCNNNQTIFTIKSTSRKKENDISSNSSKKFFHEFKDKLRCFFCGGRNCKHENYKTNLQYNNAIIGLHSNFITPDIIASQRPSEILISQYNLLSTFKENNIGLIVNLQREGEHPYCGPNAYNLTPSGYSYNPTVFTGDDIKCKLSGWKDMSVPSSMNYMLDIVKSMSEIVIDFHKKVLVHCHAGYGRTGIVIACYMLFNSEKTSEEVIQEIRTKRKKCIETKNQKHYCRTFEEFLIQTRILFGPKETIDVYLKRQEDLLFGEQSRKYGYIPKLITKTLEKIIEIKDNNKLNNELIYKILQGLLVNWNDELENVLAFMKSTLNKNNWILFEETENLTILSELLFDWIEDCVEFLISPERTKTILSNDLFLSYQGKDKSTNHQIQELLTYIKKIYHCYEYEMLFQFASFFTMVKPQTEKDNFIFMEMVDRISLELLGFNLFEINNDMEYMKSTKPLVIGLSSILILIYESLEDTDTFIFASPTRTHSNIVKNNSIFSKKIMDISKPPQIYQTTNNKLMSGMFSEEVQLNDKKEKKLFQMYSLLEKHFQNKNKKNINKTVHPNEIQNISSINKDNVFIKSMNDSLKPKELAKIIEEIMSKQLNQSNSSHISGNTSKHEHSDNSSISLKKSDREGTSEMNSPVYILNGKHKKSNMNLFYRNHKNPSFNKKENESNKLTKPCYLMFESFKKDILETKANFQNDNVTNSPVKRSRDSLFNRNEFDFSQMKKQFSKGDVLLHDIKAYEKEHNVVHDNTKLRTVLTKEKNNRRHNSNIFHFNNYMNSGEILKKKFNLENEN